MFVPVCRWPLPMKIAKTSNPSKSASKSTFETAAHKLDYAECRLTEDLSARMPLLEFYKSSLHPTQYIPSYIVYCNDLKLS